MTVFVIRNININRGVYVAIGVSCLVPQVRGAESQKRVPKRTALNQTRLGW